MWGKVGENGGKWGKLVENRKKLVEDGENGENWWKMREIGKKLGKCVEMWEKNGGK